MNRTSGKHGQGIHKPNPSVSKSSRARRHPNRFGGFDRSLSQAGLTTTNITSTGSQTYTVPPKVDSLTITMYGGGAGGALAGGGRGGVVKGGGGGGGARLVITLDEVTPGETLTFNVGAGGDKATAASGCSDSGGDTTFSYGGKDYVAGGGERNRGGNLGLCSDDGTGGAGDCDGGATCTATAGNNGTAYNSGGSTTPGGNSLETGDSSGAGAGGIGSNNGSSQNAADGQNGKVVIS